MVYFDGTKWQLCTEKIRYTEERVEKVKYVTSEGRDWWLDLARRWDGLEIIEFIPVTPTPEQLERYNDILVLNLPDGWGGTLSDYVEFGTYEDDDQMILQPALDAKTVRGLTAQVQALMLVASKQVGDLELSPGEEDKLGEFFELGPGKEPGIGESGGKG